MPEKRSNKLQLIPMRSQNITHFQSEKRNAEVIYKQMGGEMTQTLYAHMNKKIINK
jgi:hypothetical protein